MLRVGVAVFVSVVATVAQAAPRSPAAIQIEGAFRAELEHVNPAAAIAYDQATTAGNALRLDEALAGFRKASELAPTIDHPHRRACGVLSKLLRHDEAIAECERAISLRPDSPWNKLGLATALVQRNASSDTERALALAREATDLAPKDVEVLGSSCVLVMQANLPTEFRRCVDKMYAVDPNGMTTNLLGALEVASTGGIYLARQRLEVARKAGLDDATYHGVRDVLGKIETEMSAPREGDGLPSSVLLWLGIGVVACWLVGLLLVAVLGRNTVSRRVLGWCGVYLFGSIPIVLVAAAIGAVGVALDGRIPFMVVAIAAAVAAWLVGTISRRLTRKPAPEPFGRPIDSDSEPRVWALLDEVAEAVDADSLDDVYLTTGTDFAIVERTSLWSALRGGETESILGVGAGALGGMTRRQFRALLANEHGRYRTRDGHGGAYALAARRAFIEQANHLGESGLAFFDPVYWLLRASVRIFDGVARRAIREQLARSDRWAIEAYGRFAFADGLRHHVTRTATFPLAATRTIEAAVKAEQPLPNLYAALGALPEDEAAMFVSEAMNRQPTHSDEYPSPTDRLAATAELDIAGTANPDDEEPAWTLFDDREALERELTETLRERVLAKHDIAITPS